MMSAMASDDGHEDLVVALRDGSAEAIPRLRAAVIGRRDERGDHSRWGRLCERAGEAGLALTEYQLALRDDPEDVAALARLATLYDERGEIEKAIESAEQWVRVAPGDGEAADRLLVLLVDSERFERAREILAGAGDTLEREARVAWEARLKAAAAADTDEDAPVPVGMPTDADAVRFLHLFAGRENVYARQWSAEGGESGYTPVREPLTPAAVRNHLIGNITLGVYPVRLDNTVTFFAFDVDIRKAALARARGSLAEARRIKDAVAAETERLRGEMEALGVPALLEDSGYKGRHLWVFLDTPEDAAVVRQFGGLFLKSVPVASPDLQAEFFPKQASTGAGIGNLIKLPVGIHRRTGRRSRLLLPDGTPAPDPYALLRQQPRVSRDAFYAAIAALKARVAPGEAPAGSVAGTCPERVEGREEDAEPVPPEAALVRQIFPPPAPVWTAADFETNPEVAHLLGRCAVLRSLKDKVEEHRRLTHDEQVVLIHSLGHSGMGVLAVNYLLDACVDVPPTARLQSPLAGNPVSCPKIRKRIPQVTGASRATAGSTSRPGSTPTPGCISPRYRRRRLPHRPSRPLRRGIARTAPARSVSCALNARRRGIEGQAAALYFGAFGKCIRNPDFAFVKRTRRPPRDPVNAVLSFGYTLLALGVESAVLRAGLDPMVGVFHAPDYGRPSLVLDLIEEFRPVLVDTLVLRIVNRREVAREDFEEFADDADALAAGEEPPEAEPGVG